MLLIRTLQALPVFITLTFTALIAGAAQHPDSTGNQADAWLDEDDNKAPPQVEAGELAFLHPPPTERVLHSDNRIHITRTSLSDGWVQIEQCYAGLDAVEKTEIVYRYNKMRGLRIRSQRNIRTAAVTGNSVQLGEVGADASLCVQTEAQILKRKTDGKLVLRNGPFQRRYLDGFFPMHISLEISFPAESLRMLSVVPHQQPGFTVVAHSGRTIIDSWFAGSLTLEIVFAPVTGP